MLERSDALRTFIVENFLYGDHTAPLTLEDSFSERGIVDSTGILELVAFVESTYGIRVSDEEIVPENFDSLARLTQYIQRKRTGASHAG